VNDGVRAAAERFARTDCTVLTHGFADEPKWRSFAAAVAAAGAAPGQSVYAPDEVRAAVGISGVTRVQAPANLFDTRAIEARATSGVPLDLRSAYLQGVLLLDPADAEARVPGAGRLSAAVSSAAKSSGHHAAVMLLASVIRAVGTEDRVVVGVDTPQQLASIPEAIEVAARRTGLLDEFEDGVRASVAARVPERVLDPRQWTG
jgi:hypothetical protein